MSIATKVMIQIASKLGAEPWRVNVPKTVRMETSNRATFGDCYFIILHI